MAQRNESNSFAVLKGLFPAESEEEKVAQTPIVKLGKDTAFEGFLLVRSAEARMDKNNKQNLNLNLADRTGEVNAMVFGYPGQPPQAGSVLWVRGKMQDFNGRLQLKADQIRPAEKKDNVDINLLCPAAPLPPEEMLEQIQDAAKEIQSEKLRPVVESMLDQYHEKLMYYPAAQRIHHAELAGLLHHTTDMLRCARAMVQVYPFLNRDLLLSGVILHDLCKIEEMDSNRLGVVRDYTREGVLLGHLVLCVTRIQQTADRLGIEGEEILLLQHMILSHHGEPDFGSPKPPMLPEAEVLHWIDLLDARLNEMQSAAAKALPGGFTEKIFSLDRRIYRPEVHEKDQEKQSNS